MAEETTVVYEQRREAGTWSTAKGRHERPHSLQEGADEASVCTDFRHSPAPGSAPGDATDTPDSS